MASSKKTFLLKINVFKTKRAYNKPPETAVFCYTEKNNKTKALTANYSRQNDCKIIITDIITYIPCCYINKIRIIKSAIQKFLSGFIIKHGEK